MVKTFFKISTILLLFSFFYFYKLGSTTLFEEDEARLTEVAREIVQTGNWLYPTHNYEPWFHKPPLYPWLTALTFKTFGINEFTARAWTAIFGLLTILFTFLLARLLYNNKTALISACILGSSLLFIVLSRMALVDTALTFFITATLYFFLQFYTNPTKSYFLYLSAISMALAVLSKSLLGILLPCATIFFFLLFKKRLKFLLNFHIIFCFILFCFFALPWWLAEYLKYGPAFLDGLFGNFAFRIYTSTFQEHNRPLYFYPLVILLGMLPWGFHVYAGFFQSFKKSERQNALLLIIWTLVVLIFFSLAKTKIPGYILPLFPPLAILAAKTALHKITKILVPLLYFILFFSTFFIKTDPQFLQYILILKILFLILFILTLLAFYKATVPLYLATSLIFVITATNFALPLYEQQFKPVKPLVTETKTYLKTNRILHPKFYLYRACYFSSLLFYLREPIILLQSPSEILSVLQKPGSAVIFFDPNDSSLPLLEPPKNKMIVFANNRAAKIITTHFNLSAIIQ